MPPWVVMESSFAGLLLVASPLLSDPNFAQTVVFVLHHDEEGAVGVVLNRPSLEPVSTHLPEWSGRQEEPPLVFMGGPVEPAVAIGVLRAERPGESTSLDGVGLVDLASDPAANPAGPVRVFSGYSGWGPGQLESEIAEEAWELVPADIGDIFTETPEGLWSRVLRRQGGRLAMLATYPQDPSLN
jgi:putative transcriptional regulator